MYSSSTSLPTLGPLRPCSSQPDPSSVHFCVSGIRKINRLCPAVGSCCPISVTFCTASTPGFAVWWGRQTEDLTKRAVSLGRTESLSASWCICRTRTKWHRHFLLKVFEWGATLYVGGVLWTLHLCATALLSPTQRRPALTKHVSELYPGGDFGSISESETKFPLPVRTIVVTTPKR